MIRPIHAGTRGRLLSWTSSRICSKGKKNPNSRPNRAATTTGSRELWALM